MSDIRQWTTSWPRCASLRGGTRCRPSHAHGSSGGEVNSRAGSPGPRSGQREPAEATAAVGRGTPLRPSDPRELGRYELLSRLGEGGMGTVYLGRNEGGRLVAVKVVRADLADDLEYRLRFRREAQVARRVARFCTAEVLDVVDPDDGPPYLVTEFIDGPTLADSVATNGPLSSGDVERVAVSVAAALTAIHAASLVHRDLKPSNVLLSPFGPRLIDFGVAWAPDSTVVTKDLVVGTPAFMSPEQARGERVTSAADVFAWGGLVIYAATGRRPFGSGVAAAVLFRIVTSDPDLTGVDPALAEVVRAAMRRDPAARPTASEIFQQLLRLGLSEPATTMPAGTAAPASTGSVATLLLGDRRAAEPAGSANGASSAAPPGPDDAGADEPGPRPPAATAGTPGTPATTGQDGSAAPDTPQPGQRGATLAAAGEDGAGAAEASPARPRDGAPGTPSSTPAGDGPPAANGQAKPRNPSAGPPSATASKDGLAAADDHAQPPDPTAGTPSAAGGEDEPVSGARAQAPGAGTAAPASGSADGNGLATADASATAPAEDEPTGEDPVPSPDPGAGSPARRADATSETGDPRDQTEDDHADHDGQADPADAVDSAAAAVAPDAPGDPASAAGEEAGDAQAPDGSGTPEPARAGSGDAATPATAGKDDAAGHDGGGSMAGAGQQGGRDDRERTGTMWLPGPSRGPVRIYGRSADRPDDSAGHARQPATTVSLTRPRTPSWRSEETATRLTPLPATELVEMSAGQAAATTRTAQTTDSLDLVSTPGVPPRPRRRLPRLTTVISALSVLVALTAVVFAARAAFQESGGRGDRKPVAQLTIPSGLVGMSAQDAQARLRAAGFTVINWDLTPDLAPQQTVLAIRPAEGSRLTADSVVTLVVSAGMADVTVPEVVGLTEAAARERLQGRGLSVVVRAGTGPVDVGPGRVAAVTPQTGSVVPAGTTVTITVTPVGGPRAQARVPAVVGQPADAAQAAVRAAGFTNIVVTYATSDAEVGTVTAIDPAPGQSVAKNTTITLTVSTGPGQTVVPDVAGGTEADARAALQAAGLDVVVRQNTGEATLAPGLVEAVDPPAGTEVAARSRVTITVVSAEVAVPNVVGQSRAAAEDLLNRLGLTASVRQQASGQPVGRVLSQTPASGTVARGSTITITVARAPDPPPDGGSSPTPTPPTTNPPSTDPSASPPA
ncbi:MAG: PASTA domain-containing protein [Frankia sp.]|nr:PASTA domain-containing protein [Frankia sp.]